MRRVLTAAEMREADRATIEDRGVPSLVLMENAAQAVARLALERARPIERERVLVLCGKGNNGGDGLAVARQLLLQAPGLDLRVVALARPEELAPDAAANWKMLAAQDYAPASAATVAEWEALLPELRGATLVIDALLGTGVRGPLRGLAERAVADLNSSFREARILAVDMPSGLGSDSGAVFGPCLRADWTVSFTAPKASQVLPPACEQVGALAIARIGTADSVLDALPGPRLLLGEAADARAYVAPRDPSAHKGTCGHALAIGGSRAKPGAIFMAGLAALRSGAGLATVATVAGAGDAMLAARPELMLERADALADGTLGPSSFDEAWLAGKSVVAVGPGLGRSAANRELVRTVAATCAQPLVIDADGLAALEDAPLAPRAAPTVLTPHPGEMARLVGAQAQEVQRNRVETARRYARASGSYVALKGNRTLIAAPDGDIVVNPTGTPGLATAGSGDVLTGMIAGLLAQFPERPVLQTLAAAVYLHGRAGELAAEKLGEQGMLATEVLDYLAAAARELRP